MGFGPSAVARASFELQAKYNKHIEGIWNLSVRLPAVEENVDPVWPKGASPTNEPKRQKRQWVGKRDTNTVSRRTLLVLFLPFLSYVTSVFHSSSPFFLVFSFLPLLRLKRTLETNLETSIGQTPRGPAASAALGGIAAARDDWNVFSTLGSQT